MTEDLLSIRVVRTVHFVRPRWLSGKEVCEALPDDNGHIVYATLGNCSSNPNKGPLIKKRGEQGVLIYTTIDGFDFEKWLAGKNGRRSPATRGAEIDEPEVQIVKALLAAKRRLSADEILACGDHTSKESLVLRLAALVKPDGGVLERDRAEVGKPWTYGVRRDVDIDTWLRERGAARDPEPATPPAGLPAAPSKEGAEPARAAASTPRAERAGRAEGDGPLPTVEDLAGRGDHAQQPGRAAAGNVAESQSRPESALHETPARSAGAVDAVTKTAAPKISDAAGPTGAGVVEAPAGRPPSSVAAVAATQTFDIATELALVAAANLAAAVRDDTTGIALEPRIASALIVFERAFAMQGRVQRGIRA